MIRLREQIEAMRDFDWAGYISAVLQRSGFRGADLEEHLHDLVVKLLVRPGKLLRGWDPTRHGPLERRFRRSVRNGIINIAQKARNHRKWMTATDPVALAASLPSRPVHSGVLEAFRQTESPGASAPWLRPSSTGESVGGNQRFGRES